MKRNGYKIILDILMAGLLILMYKARVISLAFHEIGGLIVIGLFLIHKGISWKWIKKVSQRLFGKGIPGRTRLLYFLDVAILLSTIMILVSGIFISHELFTVEVSGRGYFWKPLHYFFSALALLLIGIHIGLHWAYIRNFFSKHIRLPAVLGKVIGILLLVTILGYGVYNLATSQFLPWLASPVAASLLDNGDSTLYPGGGGGGRGGGRGAGKGAYELEGGNSLNDALGLGRGETEGELEHEEEEATLGGALSTIASYASITTVFAFLAWLLDGLLRRRRPARTKAADQTVKPAAEPSPAETTAPEAAQAESVHTQD